MTPIDIKPDFTSELFEKLVAPLRNGEKEKIVFETIHKRKNQTLYNVEIHLQLLKFKHETLFAAIIHDISERKRTERELRESEEIFKHFMDNSPIYVFFKDENIRSIRLSKNYEKMLGKPMAELLGKNMNDLFPSELARNMIDDDIRIMKEGKQTIIEEELNGRFYSTIKFPIIIDGEPRYLAGYTIDISEQKKAEKDIKAALEKAEESDRLKSAFLANMSHEIRTPMNGILGFADLLKQPQLSSDVQQKYINIIEKSGIRMLNIINDLIDISKVESGQMEVIISDSNINEQIEYIYTFFKPEVERKGMQLFFKNPLTAKESVVKTDREKMFAILTNLVKNAIKYSDKGSIELGYEKKDNYLEFYVKDTGIGIPKERQQAIFNRFIQADITDTRAFQGAGLGLTISKAYVEMLGGKIWVESETGVGSQFYFTIPCTSVKTETENVTQILDNDVMPESQIKKLKILIAEDEENADLFLSLVLENLGKEILHVKNGIEAVEVCRNNPDTDLVLMDIMMPQMYGYEATRKIREFNKDVVIIAQTAFGLAGDREKAIEAGCDDYISKPINKQLLFELINKHIKF
jgi:PAS domain S-box-containing protein